MCIFVIQSTYNSLYKQSFIYQYNAENDTKWWNEILTFANDR